MRTLWLLLFLVPVSLTGQYRLQVEAEGVQSSEGYVLVALYKEESTFLKFEGVFRNAAAPAEKGTTTVVLDDLPPGEYALAVFHDKNGNEELDTNWLGIPKEPLGFSRSRMKTFGPPGFRECTVALREDTVIQIPLE